MDELDMFWKLADWPSRSGMVLSRKVGESIVFDGEFMLTLDHVEGLAVRVALSELHAPSDAISKTLLQKDPCEIRPGVSVTFLEMRQRRARFLINGPKDIQVCRKEIFDVLNDEL